MGTAHHKAGGEQREATTSQGKALSHLQRPGELHSTASRQACGGDGGAAPVGQRQGKKIFWKSRVSVNAAGMSWLSPQMDGHNPQGL